MLFKAAVLEDIKAGRVTLAFRRWRKPTVRAGGTLRTPIGVLSIESVAEVAESTLSRVDAKRAGFDSLDALRADLRAQPGGVPYRIAFNLAGSDPRESLRDRDQLDDGEVAALKARLVQLDRGGSWTVRCLRLIRDREGHPAGELADALDFDKAATKRKIRQLKEIGLTESLQVGYRLSKRGRAILQALDRA